MRKESALGLSSPQGRVAWLAERPYATQSLTRVSLFRKAQSLTQILLDGARVNILRTKRLFRMLFVRLSELQSATVPVESMYALCRCLAVSSLRPVKVKNRVQFVVPFFMFRLRR